MHPLARANCRPRSNQRFHADGQEYELAGRIGDGAVGIVCRARNLTNRDAVAVKFLAPDPKYIEEDAFNDVAARFKREGERGAQLSHGCLVPIIAYAENKNGEAFSREGPTNPFIIMEHIGEHSLESYIKHLAKQQRGVFLITKAKMEIAIDLAEALKYLHVRKIVHRDVKPANVFLRRKGGGHSGQRAHAMLGDFGVVKWGDYHAPMATGTLTVTNQQGLGTLKYMSPEQALEPKGVTVRADIFSLGITLFELFTGEILATPHHVFRIQYARLMRNSTVGRFQELGLRLGYDDVDFGTMLLDMFLRGASGRPGIGKVAGLLGYVYRQVFAKDEEG